ncbi:MAG: NfeD family protein [Bacillota bacterium]
MVRCLPAPLRGLLFILLMLALIPANPAQASPTDLIYVVPVKGTVDRGLANFIQRAYADAEQHQARMVILEIDTPGGAIDAAIQIRDVINESKVTTTSYVTGGAISAGALIALSSKGLVMAPGTTIGDAEPRLGSKRADEKIVSYWTAQLASAAEKNGRDGQIAASMADRDLEIPGLVAKGKLLTLTDGKAVKLGMADAVLANRAQVLAYYNLQNSQVVELKLTTAEKLARFVTNPLVSPVLLTIGIAGLVLELLTVGFGIAGVLGLTFLSLFFGGHMLAGFSGWESIVLFLAGLVLLAIEIFVIPGFGVAGIVGIAALVGGVVLASVSVGQAIVSLIFAMLGTSLLVVLSLKYLPTRNLWRGLVLSHQQLSETGYVAPEGNYQFFLGATGTAITPLRPAGVAQIGGERADVVTSGEFISPGTPVKVIKVEGTRIVVRKVEHPE